MYFVGTRGGLRERKSEIAMSEKKKSHFSEGGVLRSGTSKNYEHMLVEVKKVVRAGEFEQTTRERVTCGQKYSMGAKGLPTALTLYHVTGLFPAHELRT